jgi:hypothetical protein
MKSEAAGKVARSQYETKNLNSRIWQDFAMKRSISANGTPYYHTSTTRSIPIIIL